MRKAAALMKLFTLNLVYISHFNSMLYAVIFWGNSMDRKKVVEVLQKNECLFQGIIWEILYTTFWLILNLITVFSIGRGKVENKIIHKDTYDLHMLNANPTRYQK
jgi:uncharacterized Tic20 family protein